MKSRKLSRISRLLRIGTALSFVALLGTSCSNSTSAWPDSNDLDIKDSGGAIDGFQLTLSAEKTRVQSGDPIWVYASLKNLNGKTVYVDVDKTAEKDFFLVVQDEQRKLVAFTKYMHVMAPHPPTAEGTWNLPLKYNEDIPFRVKASQLYDMTASGTYFITLKYKSYVRVSKEGPARLHYVVSNGVRVEVMPSDAVVMAPRERIIKPS